MAVLEFRSRRSRAAALSHAPRHPNRDTGGRRPQSRVEAGVEVGKTMLILMLIALGVVALRYVLVLAYGFLH